MKIALILAAFVLFASFASATPGSFWTTNADCGTSQQSVNEFNIGETVYIYGNNFPSGSTSWAITGQNNSSDPDTVVASGNYVIDSSGAFCFPVYTIAAGDDGGYKVDVDGKSKVYHVAGVQIPEFGLIAASVALAGAVAGFIFLRKKN